MKRIYIRSMNAYATMHDSSTAVLDSGRYISLSGIGYDVVSK